MAIFDPSCRWTASVISRWRAASAGVVIIAAMGATRPALFGAIPPVTMRPTPPRARSSKKAAMRVSLWLHPSPSSSPVCIEPMITRFASRAPPASCSGDSSRG